MNIVEFNKGYIRDVESILKDNPFDFIARQRFIDKARYIKYLLYNIQNKASRKNNVLLAKEGKNISGLIVSEFAQWDSVYFGLPMGKISFFIGLNNDPEIKNRLLGALLEKCRLQGIAHLAIRVDTSDAGSIFILENHGFRLMTIEGVNLIRCLRPINFDNADLHRLKIRPLEKRDISQIIDIGREIASSLPAHYSYDLVLPQEKRQDYYIEKVKNCCKGKDKVLVLLKDKEAIGFFAYQVPADFARIVGLKQAFVSLIGIALRQRGKNIAAPFIYRSCQLILKEADYITGRVYLHNQPMSRLLDKICSFPFSQYLCCFHKCL
ncbi:MAG: hypothetical protein PHY56_05740 [Candidatus Omnitrophica bacterium]|nr:hypothetical protein [Candidatus Omnitrophota bacterium]